MNNTQNIAQLFRFNFLRNIFSTCLLNIFWFAFLVSALTNSVNAQTVTTKKQVIVLEIFDEIDPLAWRKTDGAYKLAEKNKADLILIHLNTYGGLLESGDSIRTRILNSKIPSIVFIDNNAASAGALISISCNKIYMRNGGSIGAATVVDQEGKPLPDKYQSYMRGLMRATAEARGRDPKIAEAMVDPRTYIAGINDSGKVLTFTTTEAIKNNYCNGTAETIAEVMQKENITQYELKEYEPTFADRAIGFLTNPAIAGVLILVMLGGLYFELQHPGIGLPLILGIIAALLYFAPHYIEGLAANWEILIFMLGLILIALEIFVIPGFGVAGVAGIILVVIGLTLTLINNVGFDFSLTPTQKIVQSLAIVVLSMVATLFLFIFTGNKLIESKQFQKMVLHDKMSSEKGYQSTAVEQLSLVGKTGITLSILRPSGKVEIENEVFSASAETGWIEENETIIVIRSEGTGLVVKRNS